MKSSSSCAQKLNTLALESWLWDPVCTIEAPKFEDYILPTEEGSQ